MKKITLLCCLLISILTYSQTNKEDIYPFVKLSNAKDTLYVLNTNVGLCVTEVWETSPSVGKNPIIAISDDIDYFLDKRKNCTKIVKTIKLN